MIPTTLYVDLRKCRAARETSTAQPPGSGASLSRPQCGQGKKVRTRGFDGGDPDHKIKRARAISFAISSALVNSEKLQPRWSYCGPYRAPSVVATRCGRRDSPEQATISSALGRTDAP
jgi:hypothetical protein